MKNLERKIENIRTKLVKRADGLCKEWYNDIVSEDGRFEEREHPREKNGQFAPKGGGSKGSSGPAFLKEVTNAEMHWAVKAAKNSQRDDRRWRVDVHDKTDYSNDTCFMSKHGSTVAITPDGDIVSVCKNQNDNMRGKDLMKWAVEHGGKKLDSFDGNHGFYQACGFTPISWTPFNEEYAPEGWKKGRDKAEAVIFYAYTGENTKPISVQDFIDTVKPCTGDNGYDEAMKIRDEYLGRRK